MKKIKKNVRMTSGKGGSGEEVSHFWDHSGMRRKSQKKEINEIKRENKGKNKKEKKIKRKEEKSNKCEKREKHRAE